jgi:hypothetical protein
MAKKRLNRIHGTDVPVEEPSTASKSEVAIQNKSLPKANSDASGH